MIKYPDIDKITSNFNYPQLPEQNQQVIQIGQPIQEYNYPQFQQTQQPLCQNQLQVTVFPPALYKNETEYNKKNMPPYSINIKCPSCKNYIQTRIKYQPGYLAFFSSILCCCFGLFCGCCLIPFYCKQCQYQIHFCPMCMNTIGEVE